jgi:ankyrin repeat protein
MLNAAVFGQLETVKWLLREGGSHIGEADDNGNTALILAAGLGFLQTVKWLLREGGSSIRKVNHRGWTAMLLAAGCGNLEVVAWLLEHRGADMADTHNSGATVWDALQEILIEEEDEDNAVAVTALLRVMVLRRAPLAELTAQLSPEHARVVQEGARLRVRLPAYLAQRRALLDAHCPLIAPLQDLVHGYEMPTATDELWATGLGAARQHAARPRVEDGAAAAPLRRSHQKEE